MTPSTVRPLEGALVTVQGSTQQAVVFQYNPSKVRRTLQPQVYGAEPGARSELVMLTGAPVEMISFELEIDGMNGSAGSSQQPAAASVAAQLAALELLAYPALSDVKSNDSRLASGVLEVAPFVAPLTVLVLGPTRVVPVLVQGLTVEEVLHDSQLNPLHARVAVSLRVLSYSDLSLGQPGYQIFSNYQQGKETAAASARVSGASIYGITGVDPSGWSVS